ncbi:hypothetical protein EYF80_013760 [Liparis tanakae]|uniref:Secreted protein n=1 Tax=Liparis tanakae TaxID=230148 RepID=A0A4Z2IDL7_9TELE|nr:hypothetical protein EYF80_013760 [Liparis tanakae]
MWAFQVFNVWLSSHIWLFRHVSAQLIATRCFDQRQRVSFRSSPLHSGALKRTLAAKLDFVLSAPNSSRSLRVAARVQSDRRALGRAGRRLARVPDRRLTVVEEDTGTSQKVISPHTLNKIFCSAKL